MYSYPTRLPETSNREDLQFVVSIFDDDAGDAVNLAGITKLINPGGVTSSSWQIIDGQITTTSSTSFTVPGYPVGNELLAVTMTTNDLGLGILAGDAITVIDVGGNATMIGYVISYTPATGALTMQIGMNIQMEIRSLERRHWGDDYSPWYDWGGGPPPGGDQPIILAKLGQGLSIIDMGFVQVQIPVSLLQQLQHRTYGIAMAMTNSINTRQILLGELPILYGGMQSWPWAATG